MRTASVVDSTFAVCRTPSAEVGSSRISTFAPKWTARAIATVWRSPPDSVPTAWSGPRRWIPIFAISSMATRLAVLKSMSRSGPTFLRGSRPIQKLRVTDISGIIARCWYTVAIPASIASRGSSKLTGAPSMYICPRVGLCTPAMVLMKVDLPAPVVAEQAVDLARVHGDGHAGEGDHRAEVLLDVAHLDQWCAHVTVPP